MTTQLLEKVNVSVPESYLPNKDSLIQLQDVSNIQLFLELSSKLAKNVQGRESVDRKLKEKSPEEWNLLTPMQDLAEEVTRQVIEEQINPPGTPDKEKMIISNEFAFEFISNRGEIKPQLEFFILENITRILEEVSPSKSNNLIAQILYYSSYIYFRNIR